MSIYGRNADRLDEWIFEQRIEDGKTEEQADLDTNPPTDLEREWAMQKLDEERSDGY